VSSPEPVRKSSDSIKNIDKKKVQKRKLDSENKEPKAAKVRNIKQTKNSGKKVPISMDADESDSDVNDNSSVANSDSVTSQESQEIPIKKRGKNVSDKNSKSNVRTSKNDTIQKPKSLINGAKTDSPVRTLDSPKSQTGSARKRKASPTKDASPVKKSKQK